MRVKTIIHCICVVCYLKPRFIVSPVLQRQIELNRLIELQNKTNIEIIGF